MMKKSLNFLNVAQLRQFSDFFFIVQKSYLYYHVQYTLLQRPDVATYWEKNSTCILNAYIGSVKLLSKYIIKRNQNQGVVASWDL